ncbi:MAG TPA: DUF2182 domain-containing protein [Chloroflexota bacterium]|nr:DUF2182 domain-containing protein [Chloroflexota bacterium]
MGDTRTGQRGGRLGGLPILLFALVWAWLGVADAGLPRPPWPTEAPSTVAPPAVDTQLSAMRAAYRWSVPSTVAPREVDTFADDHCAEANCDAYALGALVREYDRLTALHAGTPAGIAERIQAALPGARQAAAAAARWASLVLLMVAPAAGPGAVRYLRARQAAIRGRRGALAFGAAYAGVWVALAGLVGVLAAGVAALCDLSASIAGWLGAHGAALGLAAAGFYQISQAREGFLAACRRPPGAVPAGDRIRTACAAGRAEGLRGVGAVGVLAAAPVVGGLVAGSVGPGWVIATQVAIVAELALPRGERVARAIGACLLASAAVLAVWPELVAR